MISEILAPAGDEQTAYAALRAGADAIYLGLTKFSARSSAENFDASALSRVTRFAHLLGAKVYVALNTLVKDGEVEDFFSSLRTAWQAGADAILIQDIFLGKLVKELYPDVVLHLSTQGGCCNVYGAQLAKEYGFSRVVLARETPLSEIEKITQIIETEVFVQGALCTCFSGQCYMSSFAGGNSGNRGRCKQPCRKKYSVDRMGYENPAYSLSLSDLSVGPRVEELLRAGVLSLKIEGRMRRPEYCAAAVKYYRTLLDKKEGKAELSRLMRTYNRGDYTQGLAFGQDKRFLSRKVQGHIGEDVGEISLVKGKFFCRSDFAARKGDGFKILRKGEEVGGATFLESGKGGFFVSSRELLRAGDRVRVTTDTSLVFSDDRRREISLSIRFVAGEKPVISCGGFVYEGGEVLPEAKNAPLTEEEIATCFAKTDGLPLLPICAVETSNAFCPKSALNAMRREFYGALCDFLDEKRAPMSENPLPELDMPPAFEHLTAVISEIGTDADITIIKPRDYAVPVCGGGKGTYLYLPPFFTSEDEKHIAPHIHNFEGIYCEGYYGVLLAKKYGVKLFAGTGFNLTNRYAVVGVKEAGATYFALSKEISALEQRALLTEGAFILGQGGIKVMDLCYCPFEKTCNICDKRGLYTLTDEEGRKFPLRRYVLGGCRFEVYNCAPLKGARGANILHDNTVTHFDSPPTGGHADRSVL